MPGKARPAMEPLSGISGNETHRNGTTEQDGTSLQPFGIKPDMKEQLSSADKPEMSATNPGGENITAELLSGKSRDQEHVRDKVGTQLHFEMPARMDEGPEDEISHSKPCSKEGEITDEAGTKENESIFESPDQKVQLLASAEANITDKETPMDIEEQLVQMETGSAHKEEQAQPDETKRDESKLTHVENESLQEEKKTEEKDAIPVKKVESKEDVVGSNIYHEKEQVHQKVEEMHEEVGEAHQKKDKEMNRKGDEEKMDQEGAELHHRGNEDHRKDEDLNQKDEIHQQDKIHQKVDEVHHQKKEQVHQEEEVSQGKEEIREEKEEVHQKQEVYLEKEEVHHQEKVHQDEGEALQEKEKVHEKLEVHKEKERVHEEEEVHHGKEEVHHGKEEVHHQENINQDKQEVHRKKEKMHQVKKETNGKNEGQSTNMDAVDEKLSSEPSKKALAVEDEKTTKVDEADANSSKEVTTVKDKTGLNAEDEDEEHVPLLERPAETSGRRERRAVERFSESTPDSKRTSLPLEEGRGTRLADCPAVSHCITNASAEELHALHQVVQGRQGRPHELRRNLRQFNGFPFERDSAAYEKKKECLLRYRANVLRTLSSILDLDKGKSREEMALAVLEFLTDPQPSGREVKPKQKAKQKPPSKKPERSSARKAAADAQGGEEGESGTEEEQDSDGGEAGESEEEKPAVKKTQRKRTPAKRTPAKKTPAKRASARNTPAKKTPTRKTPNRKSAAKKTPAKKTPAKAAAGKKTPSKKTPQRKRKREEEPTTHSPSDKEEEPAAKRSRDKSGTKRTRSSTQPTPGL